MTDQLLLLGARSEQADHAPKSALSLLEMTSDSSPALEAALTQASDELQLQSWYRDCVRPLLRMPRAQWPHCCGGGCEPCNQTLVAVATRVQELLGIAPT